MSRLNVKSPVRGTIDVRTKGARNADWDVAIVDRKSQARAHGSAELGPSKEYASTFVAKGQRPRDPARAAATAPPSSSLRYRFTKLPKVKGSSYKLKQVRISATSKAALKRLEALGLDLADSNGGVYWDALLHSARDEAKLKKAGYSYKVLIGDLNAHDRRNRLAEERASRAAASGVRARASALASGRTSYRDARRDQRTS